MFSDLLIIIKQQKYFDKRNDIKRVVLVSLGQSDDYQQDTSRPGWDLTALHVHMLTERFSKGHSDHNDE